jgi:hypothetical protein
VARRGRRRRKQLLNDMKEKRGYWILNEEAPELVVDGLWFCHKTGLQNE